MKINVKSPGKIALSVIVYGFFVASCSNRGAADDTKPATVVGGTDTTMTVSPDSMAADQTHLPPPVDTSNKMAKPDTAATGSNLDTASKAKPAKSTKKDK